MGIVRASTFDGTTINTPHRNMANSTRLGIRGRSSFRRFQKRVWQCFPPYSVEEIGGRLWCSSPTPPLDWKLSKGKETIHYRKRCEVGHATGPIWYPSRRCLRTNPSFSPCLRTTCHVMWSLDLATCLPTKSRLLGMTVDDKLTWLPCTWAQEICQ